MITIEWDADAIQWIHEWLPRFADRLVSNCKGTLIAKGDWAKDEFLPRIPEFSGDLKDDFQVKFLRSGNDVLRLWVGERGYNRVRENSAQYNPFSYAWAKHDGAEPHRVWLYASNTKARRRLRRYVRQFVPNLPETEKAYEKLSNRGDLDFPPFIDVDPRASATPYIDEIMPYLKSEITDDIRRLISTIW